MVDAMAQAPRTIATTMRRATMEHPGFAAHRRWQAHRVLRTSGVRSGGKALAVSVSAAVFVTTLTALMAPGTVRAVPLPTGLPISATTSIHLRSQRRTGTIPTELGLLTRLTYVDIAENWLTGPMPTELGLLTLVNSSFSLGSNLLSLAIPTQYR